MNGLVTRKIMDADGMALIADEIVDQIRSDLDLAGDPAATRVVVAMSGGVDSSVVAALVKAAGYDVVGITLQLYDHGVATGQTRTCCAGRDIHDARRVAARLDIPHYVLDFESRFRQAVIDDFADSYLAGETPIPCVRCNQTVKFADLFSRARSLGAAALATGHYVRSAARAHTPHRDLLTPVDTARDQSYFLFATTQEQADFLRFPLGAFSKQQVRALAADLGLGVADKPDSQDICFVPQGRYGDVIAKLRPGAAEPGDIVDLDGRTLGRHEGIVHFTVGQRRGLGLAMGEPRYVVRLDAGRREVVVGPHEALLRRHIRLREVNWLGLTGGAPDTVHRVHVKIRSTRPAVPASLTVCGRDAAVTLDSPEAGVSPGQACVFYAGEGAGAKLLGGGFIASASLSGYSGQPNEAAAQSRADSNVSEEMAFEQ
jgi:tRNA-uridine 2-sulfurtransferase